MRPRSCTRISTGGCKPGADSRARRVLEAVVGPQLANPAAQETLGKMLNHSSIDAPTGVEALGRQTGAVSNPEWLPVLQSQLQSVRGGRSTLVLGATEEAASPQFHQPWGACEERAAAVDPAPAGLGRHGRRAEARAGIICAPAQDGRRFGCRQRPYSSSHDARRRGV